MLKITVISKTLWGFKHKSYIFSIDGHTLGALNAFEDEFSILDTMVDALKDKFLGDEKAVHIENVSREEAQVGENG